MNDRFMPQPIYLRAALLLLASIACTQLAGCVVAAVGGAAVAGIGRARSTQYRHRDQ